MSPFSGVATLAAAEPTQAVQAASGVFTLTWLLIALPLLGAAVLLLGGRRTDKWGHWLGVLMSAGSFVVGVVLFVGMLGQASDERVVPPAPLRLDRASGASRCRPTCASTSSR